MSSASAKLAALRKKIGSEDFSTGSLDCTDFISTGCFALNRIISGDFYQGIPSNKIILIGGISMSGKSLIAALTAINALKENKVQQIFVFDSEGGFSKQLFLNAGVDLSKVEWIPLDSVEDAAHKILATYDTIKEIQKEDPGFRALSILDSLGALVTRKAFKDIGDDNAKLDRGLRARLINDLSKILTMPVLLTKCGLIVLNHVYDDPNAMYVSKIKNQSGGRGIQYMNRLTLQCTKSLDKEKDKENEFGTVYKGTFLKFMAIKNNIVIPFVETEVEIDFKIGWASKYTGLVPLACHYGFIDNSAKGWFAVPTYENGKKVRESDLLYNGETTDKIWNSFIKELNEKQKTDMQYGNFAKEIPGKIDTGDGEVVDEESDDVLQL